MGEFVIASINFQTTGYERSQAALSPIETCNSFYKGDCLACMLPGISCDPLICQFVQEILQVVSVSFSSQSQFFYKLKSVLNVPLK